MLNGVPQDENPVHSIFFVIGLFVVGQLHGCVCDNQNFHDCEEYVF